MRALAISVLVLCGSCGRDETLNIYLVFPANVQASSVKSSSLIIEAAGTGTCEAPTAGTKFIQVNEDGAPASKGGTSAALGREQIPTGAVLFIAKVWDTAGATGKLLASGCTEALNDPKKNLEVLIELSHP
jgi:hypothetical protein